MKEIYLRAERNYIELALKIKSGNYNSTDVCRKNRFKAYCKRMERMYFKITYQTNGYDVSCSSGVFSGVRLCTPVSSNCY